MLRRPNRASWNEESAGRPSPLAQLLASPRPLPAPHPSSGFVGSRHDLPGMIGYGKMQQKPLEGSMFSGAQTPNPQTTLTHAPPQMPTFSQANSRAGEGSAAPTLAALGLLTGTPHGGPATPTLPPGPGTNVYPDQPGGRTTGAYPDQPGGHILTTGVYPTQAPSHSTGVYPDQAPSQSTLTTGVYPGQSGGVGVPGAIAAAYQNALTNPDTPDFGVSPGTLMTLLAQLGQKANPSAPPAPVSRNFF